MKALAERGVDLTLVTKNTQDIREEHLSELKNYCRQIILVKSTSSKFNGLWRLLKSLFSLMPFLAVKRIHPEAKKQIVQYLSGNEVDAVVCDSIYQSLNIPFGLNNKTILYEHNVESLIIKRYARMEGNIIKKIFALFEYAKMERLQSIMWRRFNIKIVCSQKERRYVRERVPRADVFVIPNGVDIDFFSPDNYPPSSASLVYTGQIGWYPNEDAVMYFVKNIFPFVKEMVPGVNLWIVGNNPSLRVRHLSLKDEAVKVTGFVEDVRPFIGKAKVYIVPLRIGGGTRLKILEAMAMHKPVVSTSVGCEGLDVADGRHLLVRDNPREFAQAIAELVKDKELSAGLATAGRKLVREKYDWRVVFKGLDEILDRVAGGQ